MIGLIGCCELSLSQRCHFSLPSVLTVYALLGLLFFHLPCG